MNFFLLIVKIEKIFFLQCCKIIILIVIKLKIYWLSQCFFVKCNFVIIQVSKMEVGKNNIENENYCIVCGNELIHLVNSVSAVCSFCEKTFSADFACNENHYVCNDCLHLEPKEIVKIVCLRSTKTDPIDLAKEIMASPAIKMHGPEHHFITPAVLLTTVANYTNSRSGLEERIQRAEELATKFAPNCSWHLGTCGAALGASIFLIVWNNLEPNNEASWDEGNYIVSNSLKRIAELGSPRCCKRDTYIAIEEATEYLRKKYGINLPVSEAKCDFSLRNRTCKHEDCIFFNLKYSLV